MINIIGPCFGISGYDSHCRQLANALNKLVPVRLSTQLHQGVEKLISDQELQMIKRAPENDEINLIITNPAGWLPNLNAKRNWVFLIWEGDKIPLWILEQCLDERIEKIFVASEHTKKALENTWQEYMKNEISSVKIKGWTIGDVEIEPLKKVCLTPHGVDLNKFYPMDKPNKLTFVLNKGFKNLEDRGGVQYFLKAYLEEFKSTDNVEALIKINPAYGVPNLDKLILDLKIQNKDAPKIAFDINAYDYKELVKLYNKGNVFVSPTRAEAYNLGCIEAMACGLPVITTNFGGQTDYVNENNGWIIGGELTEIKHELFYEGIKWLTPDIKELQTVMREIYTNQPHYQIKGTEARKTAQENTWDKTANQIVKLI